MALLILFILTPVVEIAVFIEVGSFIGLWPTLAVVVVTATAGTWLLRRQGVATFYRAQEALNQGQFPVTEVFDGMCLLFAGALLLTPGFVTDATGFLLFVPPLRRSLRRAIVGYLQRTGKLRVWGDDAGSSAASRDSTTIEGDFHEIRPGERPDDAGKDGR